MKKSFKIIVITPDHFLKNEISSVNKLFKDNLDLLHLRKPNFTKEEMTVYLKQIPKLYYKRIVLHSHYELIKKFKLKGAHLSGKSRATLKTTGFLKRNKIKIISTSFHSTKEVRQCRRKYEYVFLSPIFKSISKNNYGSNFKLNELKPMLVKSKNKILALSGVTNKNIMLTKQTGFSGVATIGYIWKSKTPIKKYKMLRSKIK